MKKFARSTAILVISVEQQYALVELTNEPKLIWSDIANLSVHAESTDPNETYALHLSKGSVSFRRIGEDSRGSSLWSIERSSQEISVDAV